jgi:hypothetical protein
MPARSSVVQASLVSYELQSLGWKAFQDLCATITSEVLGQTVQVFLSSKDGGRDGAFQGTWKKSGGEEFDGPFTVQCKFTSKRDQSLTLSDVTEEVDKARILASKNLAKTYVLMTNCGVSGVTEQKLREVFLAIPGIEHFAAFGNDWITLRIRENSRLRLLVPRVYGLGDLSQILDERAYAQAQDILFSMGEDLAKFVVTDAYRKAATALIKHGFVILLGEPAAGKSTIAAHLSLGAIDNWECSTLKVRNAEEFVQRWNPNEPKQFFWIDDAFGTTQYQRERADEWNQVFPHLMAAIRKGAKVLFTSRDYIFRAASADLKRSAFPLITSSQVIINVQALNKEEKEQILYNHIKLGDQPAEIRLQLRPHLSDVASHPRFLPEIARRLGSQFFTKNLFGDFWIGPLMKDRLGRFVEHPLDFLIEVVESLDRDSFGAIALVFINGGRLESPIAFSELEERALGLLGTSVGDVQSAFSSLDGSLLKLTKSEGTFAWTYKHPTTGDAFASVVATNRELLDIYLAGTRIQKLIGEVVCGGVQIQGAKVVVPHSRYVDFIPRLDGLQSQQLYQFLTFRTDQAFLKQYVDRHPSIYETISSPNSLSGPEAHLLARLHEAGLLPEEWRIRFVERGTRLAVETPDADFLSSRIRPVFSDGEVQAILERVESELLPTLRDLVRDWEASYYGSDDPDEYFEPLVEALTAFHQAYPERSSPRSTIMDAIHRIEDVSESIREEASEYGARYEPDYDMYEGSYFGSPSERSTFDDVNE